MTLRQALIPLAIFSLLISMSQGAWGDDSDQPDQVLPNRMKVNPKKNQEPPARIIALPDEEGATGSHLGPAAGSQMGIGIQFPFGGAKAAVPDAPPLKKKKADQDKVKDSDSGKSDSN